MYAGRKCLFCDYLGKGRMVILMASHPASKNIETKTKIQYLQPHILYTSLFDLKTLQIFFIHFFPHF